ncbi:hypothetical protein [Micromonospora cathayae]|uniref:Uncharacterized protein n=1 Tax=Micromonospora cathayae TaxID=3028804 RepID=A0ABY7ZLT1_9ACTN|nr:hypothetical protein [Micromonospora sp. HUAS 3]WDZ83247.1 hypothetical protein PVK37_22680 [Micromonospora sp. HUAS 3]
MTGPFLSPAQLRNRLTLAARRVLRTHRTAPDGRCRVCRVPDCPAAVAARDRLGRADPSGEATEHRQ